MQITNKFLDKITEYCANNSSNIILSDIYRDYTMKEIEEISSRVYSYLYDKKISREDVVMIKIPRSSLIFITLLGIFKAGACGVIVADWTTDDYYKFFVNDTKPKLIVDRIVMEEMLSYAKKDGYQRVDEHDLAFICYTSSSTGFPKGVMHEYGNINRFCDYIEYVKTYYDFSTERRINLTALYDMGSFVNIMGTIYNNIFIRIPKKDLFLDRKAFIEEANKYKITCVSTMSKLFDENLYNQIPSLDYIVFTYETVEGVKSNKLIYNCYGMTESMTVLSNESEQNEEYDIVPTGKPMDIIPIYIVDENDNILKDGEIGEIAFNNPYFRGYLGREEETKMAKRNGLFHTGDIGKFLPDGQFVVLDRKANTVMTKNGIIVSNIIKVKLKKILKANWLYVVSLKENEKVKIVVFYNEDISIEKEKIERELLKELPKYMLPTHYKKIDEIPTLISGKINISKLIAFAKGVE